jgi:hypothetical protein
MLRHIARAVDKGLGEQLRKQTRSLHRSVIQGRSAARNAATRLRTTTASTIDRIAAHDFSNQDVVAILNSIIGEGLAGEFSDYAAAEQTTMAAGNVVAVLDNSGAISESRLNELNVALDKLYDATANDEKFQPHRFAAALRGLRTAAPK